MSDIFQFLREFRPYFNKYAVDEMAKAHGHTVLRLPPYHCVFNPIELLWGYQKQVLRRESSSRTIEEAQQACKRVFAKIPKDDLSRYFDHVKGVEAYYAKQEGFTAEHPPVIIRLDDDDDEEEDQPLLSHLLFLFMMTTMK